MRTKRFDFNYRPLNIISCMEVVGSVPNAQEYDESTAEWLPDYELTNASGTPISPLILRARVQRNDPSGALADKDISADLTNVVWKWVETDPSGNVAVTTIGSGNPQFTIGTGGTLTIKKNIPRTKNVAVVFTADYLDPRNAQVYPVYLTERLALTVLSAPAPEIHLDQPTHTAWNPTRDPHTFTVNATLLRRDRQEVAATFLWEKHRADGTWSAIGSEDGEDFGYTISNGGKTLTQDMRLMGSQMEVRVRATYGDLPTLSDASPAAFLTLVRRIPEFTFDFTGAPTDIEDDTDSIAPHAIVTDRRGVLENPSKELLIVWKAAREITAGAYTWQDCGNGEDIVIPTTLMQTNGAMVVGLDVSDRGAPAPVVDSKGRYLADSQGRIVFNRI